MRQFINLYDGESYWFTSPQNHTYKVEEIFHSLASVNRFVGHQAQIGQPISVLQHSLAVAYLLPPGRMRLLGLLHDASEAYLNDVSAPVKYLPELAGYRDLEARIQNAIYNQLIVGGVPSELEAVAIKEADTLALHFEAYHFMSNSSEWEMTSRPPESDIPYEAVDAYFLIAIEAYERAIRIFNSEGDEK